MTPLVAKLPANVAEHVLGSIAFTASPAVANMGAAGQALVQQARDAFVTGVASAVFVGCVVLAVAAVVVFVAAGPEPERSAA
jgi:hypothetical protein